MNQNYLPYIVKILRFLCSSSFKGPIDSGCPWDLGISFRAAFTHQDPRHQKYYKHQLVREIPQRIVRT